MAWLLQDLRFGVRVLLRNGAFTLLAVAALALGIGPASAVFSVIYGVLLKPLPYREPGRLVRVYQNNPVERFERFPLSPADFLDYRKQNRVFENIAVDARQDQQYGGNTPERLVGVRISHEFFRVLGIEPALGRDFTVEDEQNFNAANVAIISYGAWKRLLGGDLHVIGKNIRLDDAPFRIVGIMPRGFEHVTGGYRLRDGEAVDVWLPYDRLSNPRGVNRGAHFCNTIARLKPGITIEQAQAEMDVLAKRLEAQYPDDSNWRVQLKPLRDDLVGNSRPTLLILLGAVAFVLLIACVNVANLLLARAAVRDREMAIRTSVGASRTRLVRQMLTESVTLAALGGAVGLLLAWWGVRTLLALAPAQLPRVNSIRLDPYVVLATAGMSLVCGLLFGLAPALTASTQRIRASSRPHGLFVIAQIGLTFVLLIGAGLLLRTFTALGRVDPGFHANGVLTMSTALSYAKLTGARRYAAFYEGFIEKLEQLPGVTAAGATTNLPWSGANDNAIFALEGRPRTPGAAMHAHYLYVSPDYLRAIGAPLLAGRWLSTSDHFDAPKVVVINKALALQHWPTVQACLGQRIATMKDFNTVDSFMTIVGVVGDIKDSPTDGRAQPALYEPFLQQPSFGNYVAVRTTGDVRALIPAVRRVAREVGNDFSIQDIRPMEDVLASAVATQRFALQLIGVFAAVALALALIGIYGVTAFATSRRTREIAIRSALGATPGNTLRLLLGGSVRLIVPGLLAGGAAALALTRVLKGILFQVSPGDPLTFAAVTAALATVAIAATYAPVRKALRIDPSEALRQD